MTKPISNRPASASVAQSTPTPIEASASTSINAENVALQTSKKAHLEYLIEKFSGGKIYWISWLLLTLSFLFFGYQCMGVYAKLRALDTQMRSMQSLLETIAKRV
jgi:hypothetical protein